MSACQMRVEVVCFMRLSGHHWDFSDESDHQAEFQEEGERYRFTKSNPKATQYRQRERFQGLVWMKVIEVIPLNCVLLSIGVCPFPPAPKQAFGKALVVAGL